MAKVGICDTINILMLISMGCLFVSQAWSHNNMPSSEFFPKRNLVFVSLQGRHVKTGQLAAIKCMDVTGVSLFSLYFASWPLLLYSEDVEVFHWQDVKTSWRVLGSDLQVYFRLSWSYFWRFIISIYPLGLVFPLISSLDLPKNLLASLFIIEGHNSLIFSALFLQ